MLFDVSKSIVPWTSKWAFTTRRVDRSDVHGLSNDYGKARAGDVLFCTVARIGQHRKLQLSNQRYSEVYVGDEVVVCVGNRYAPDQFLGFAHVAQDGCDLIAGGGIAGQVQQAHASMKTPTRLKPIGLLEDASGEIINVDRYREPRTTIPDRTAVIVVVGSSMNSGKTTAAVSLAHGLTRSGYQVAGVKATGTGAFGDFNAMQDAGVPALDFTDAGYASTFKVPADELTACFKTLVGTAAKRGADIAVVEIADGIFQDETAALLTDPELRDRIDGVVFAAPDALSSAGGVHWLRSHGLPLIAVSGKVTTSPVALSEAVAQTSAVHVDRSDLCDPAVVTPLVASVIAKVEARQSQAA